nr:hypothetical protein [Tanacetum cinerariifolium]
MVAAVMAEILMEEAVAKMVVVVLVVASVKRIKVVLVSSVGVSGGVVYDGVVAAEVEVVTIV